MTHYSEDQRDAFAAWVDAGLPDTAQVRTHEPEALPAHEFLSGFLDCTDPVPAALRDALVERLRAELGSHSATSEFDEEDFETYAQTARELLELLPELRLTRARHPMEGVREAHLLERLEVVPVRGERLVFLGERIVGKIAWDDKEHGFVAALLPEEYLGGQLAEPEDTDEGDDFGVREIARRLAEQG